MPNSHNVNDRLGRVSQCVLVLFIALGLSSPGLALSDKDSQVLWVFSWNNDTPWQKELEAGFQQYSQQKGSKASVYYEYMDGGRFNAQAHQDIFWQYLKDKYADVSLDYVVFEGEPATHLYQEHAADFADTKVIVLNTDSQVGRGSQSSLIIPVKLDLEKATQAVLDLEPDQDIYLLVGTESISRPRLTKVLEYLEQKAPQRNVKVLKNDSVEVLKDQVSQLKNAVIIYLLYFEDSQGNYYLPYNVMQQVSQVTTVPVYTFWTSLLGSGVIGGYMLSGEQVGREAAKIIVHDTFDQHINSQTSFKQDLFHGYYFDWRELERWGKPKSFLTEDSEILFYQPGLLQRYSREIAVSIIMIVVLFLWYRNRVLKHMSATIRDAHNRLQQNNQVLHDAQIKLQLQNRKLAELSVRDGLTGLYNRSYLNKMLTHEFAMAERYGSPLSLIMVDVDHFKAINDKYGHSEGDKVLIRLSKLLSCNIRSTDVLARWGGEEFMILCPGLKRNQAFLLAEKLRHKIANVTIGNVGRVSASFGVAAFDQGMSLEELIEMADIALYESKANGRNRVTG